MKFPSRQDCQILIKSELKGKKFLKYSPLVLFGSAIINEFICRVIENKIDYLNPGIFENIINITFFITAVSIPVCWVLGIIMCVLYLDYRKCHLFITEKNIKGTAHWGKKVVLPLYMVSAYSTRKLFWTISVSTSSGTTRFSLIKNYSEIGKVLEQAINERQANTQKEVQPTVSVNNSLDDLIKLKTLLDMGAITKEEFDAKKKQLLGL